MEGVVAPPNCGAFNGHDGRCNAPAERKVLMEGLVHDIVHVSIPHGPAGVLVAHSISGLELDWS